MSRYVYDKNQQGLFEKAREAAAFGAWCVAVGGGLGGVYAYKTYGGFENTVIGFCLGTSIFTFLGILRKFLEIK